jgi:phosphoglycolate phosphatase-like HAD superfamily hydrolase
MKILLFDMDGVLLESHGYHLALQETVRYMAKVLGLEDLSLSDDDIATFEAGGITNEWDEAAISTALLLEAVWKIDAKRTFPKNLLNLKAVSLDRQPAPDFNALARRLSSFDLRHLHPLERALYRFTETDHSNKMHYKILHDLLEGAHDPQRSLTHRLFQELVLGSAEYAHIYDLPATLECESYLLKYDISNLSLAESTRLLDWLSSPGHAATVITCRPSYPPAGVFSTPEAELGATLVGLQDIPIVGWGGISWLAKQRHVDQQTFCKPSPVHALAALRVALGDEQETALMEASNLIMTGQSAPAWQRLAGAQVCIFEDTPDGIKSLQDAQAILEKLGISIKTSYYGITRKPIKRKVLLASSAQVFPSITQALDLSI